MELTRLFLMQLYIHLTIRFVCLSILSQLVDIVGALFKFGLSSMVVEALVDLLPLIGRPPALQYKSRASISDYEPFPYALATICLPLAYYKYRYSLTKRISNHRHFTFEIFMRQLFSLNQVPYELLADSQ